MAKQSKFDFMVSHKEASALIAANGSKLSYIVEGEPGISKSSILKTLKASLGDAYDYVYVDVPLKDIPDIALSMPDHATQTTKAYVNSLWLGSDPKKPKVIMLDEVFKGTPYVQLMMNRLLLERCVGDYQLPEGSIVFGTTNLSTDGVGDRTNGHTNSRVSRIIMRKPNLQEWVSWGANNGVHELVLAWVNQNPNMFESYTTHQEDVKQKDGTSLFHYIFHPQHNNQAYVCPRTLELASHQLKNLDLVGRSITEKGLIGVLGLKAALDMSAYIDLGKDLPLPQDIDKDPNTARIPANPIAKLMMVYKSLQYLNNNNLDNYVTYFKRMDNAEIMVTWVRTIMDVVSLSNVTSNKAILREFLNNQNIL